MNTPSKRSELQSNLETDIANEQQHKPFVSVIVPIYNDTERLKICLEALSNQTYPTNCYEIIVVDNASDKDQNVKSVIAKFEKARDAYCSTPGSYAARNHGLALAKGEIIAFTDADCIPKTNWIEQGVKNILNIPNCGLLAGKVELFFKDADKLTPVELYESITAFSQQQMLDKYKGAATANVFTFKNVIEKVGNFDANLKSGGDLEWGQRVFDEGYKQFYAEDVQVAHPARHSWNQIYQKTIRTIAGAYTKQCRTVSIFEKRKITLVYLIQNLSPPLVFFVNVFRDSRLQGIKPKMQVSFIMLFIKYARAWEIIRLQLGAEPSRV